MNKYLYLFLLIYSLNAEAQYSLCTVAGSGVSLGFSGDGALAKDALLYNPYSTAIDSKGNIFIADYLNHRIRKIDTLGFITTIAGSATYGYSGDGGLAINAELNYPSGIAIDAEGNIYIADKKNNCIRKIDADGIISTFAGSITAGFGGDGNIPLNAFFDSPSSLAIDDLQNIFVVDYGNNRIREISNRGIISTFAGTGTPGYSGDGGLSKNAQLNFPEGITIDKQGNIYISDTQNRRVRKINTSGIITTVAGNGTAGFNGNNSFAIEAQLNTPKGIACDTVGNIYFADSDNNVIRKIDINGIISTAIGENGTLANIKLSLPIGITCDKKGNFLVADTYNSAVRKLTPPPPPIPNQINAITNSVSKNDGISVFPNPTDGTVFIYLSENSANSDINIYTATGQKVKTKLVQVSDIKYSADLSEQAVGIYFINIKTDKQTTVKKISLVK